MTSLWHELLQHRHILLTLRGTTCCTRAGNQSAVLHGLCSFTRFVPVARDGSGPRLRWRTQLRSRMGDGQERGRLRGRRGVGVRFAPQTSQTCHSHNKKRPPEALPGWLQSSNVCGRILTSTAWGFVAARYGRKMVLAITLVSLLMGGSLRPGKTIRHSLHTGAWKTKIVSRALLRSELFRSSQVRLLHQPARGHECPLCLLWCAERLAGLDRRSGARLARCHSKDK